MDHTHHDATETTEEHRALEASDPADAPPIAEEIAEELQSELDDDEGHVSD